jgi:prophage antirepressor-like protein
VRGGGGLAFLSLFNFKDHPVRVVDIDGNPWFVGSEALHILYGRASGIGWAYERLAADEKTKVDRTYLGMKPGRKVVLVSESGLYKLIMRSDKPEAKQFQDWIAKEVLPSIRKNGGYIKDQEKVLTGGYFSNRHIFTIHANGS